MITTTQLAQTNGKQIVEKSNDDQVRIQECRDSTFNALKLFPDLNSIPNIDTYCMNIWQAETNFTQFGKAGNSRGNSLVCSKYGLVPDNLLQWKAGTDFYDGFWNSPVIVNYRKQHSDQDPAIVDGLYAHGVSQCMGAYNIEGTPASKSIFSSNKYIGVSTSEHLLVQAGTPVTNIYTDDIPGRRKSITAGIMVLDYHYNYWIKQSMTNDTLKKIVASLPHDGIPTNTRLTQFQAITLAAGSYLGFGKDINGASGTNRANFVVTNREWRYYASNNKTAYGTGAKTYNSLGCT